MLVFTALAALWCLAVNRPGHFGQLLVPWVIYGLASGPLVPVTLGTYMNAITVKYITSPATSLDVHTQTNQQTQADKPYRPTPHILTPLSLNNTCPSFSILSFFRSGCGDDLSDPCR